MVRNILKILAVFLLGMGGGIFADQILFIYFEPVYPVRNAIYSGVYVTGKKEVIIQENTALKNAVEKTEKTVIGVRTKLESGEVLEGSGLIVTSDGLIVTLADLVPQGSVFSFYINGSSTSYQILKRDLKENLTLVNIGRTNMPTLSFADLEKIKLGERVFLIGNVFKGKTAFLAVNEGIVRNFNEDFIETNILEKNYLSGSPLFNIEGEVLGINTINSEGKVIAIPISKIKIFIGL
jgi:S1-C subfamily serine protease